MTRDTRVDDAQFAELLLIDAIGRYVEDTSPAPILTPEDLSVGAMAGFTPQEAAAILIDVRTRRQLMETWDAFQRSRKQQTLPTAIERIMAQEAASGGPQWHVVLANETGLGTRWLDSDWPFVLATLPASVREAMDPNMSAGGVPAYEYDAIVVDRDLQLTRGGYENTATDWDSARWDLPVFVQGFRIGVKIRGNLAVVGLWCETQAQSGFYDLILTWANGDTHVVERLEATPGETQKRGDIPCLDGGLPVEVSIRVARS